jgi:hypothetical protein
MNKGSRRAVNVISQKLDTEEITIIKSHDERVQCRAHTSRK